MKFSKSLLRRKRKSESWFKYLIFLSHLWLGLLSALVLFIVCLTGAIYALKPVVHKVVHRNMLYVDTSEKQGLPIDSLISGFKAAYEVEQPYSVRITPGESTLINYYKRGEKSISAYMHPVTGEVLGEPNESFNSFFSTMLYLHRWLLVYNPGRTIVGVSVLIFIFLLLGGLVLWWPRSKKLMKNGLKINFRIKGYKMIHQLHNVLGFYSLSALVFLSLTGLYFSFHWVRSGLIVALGGEPLEQRSHKKKEQNKPPTADFIAEQAKLKQSAPNIECHLAMVNDVLPYVGKTSVYLPRDAGSGIRVRRYRTDNWLNARLPDAVTFSVSGEIVKVERFNDLPLHRQFRAISRPLHTGELFGTIGCIVYALIALIGASLPLTGFLLWWKKLK